VDEPDGKEGEEEGRRWLYFLYPSFFLRGEEGEGKGGVFAGVLL